MLIDAKSSVKKQILRELDIMHECQSEYIVSCYGSFLAEPNICICMEFADKGSFDAIYKRIGPLDVEVVGLVALSVLEGLSYLYDVHHIMHRGKYSPTPANGKADQMVIYQTSSLRISCSIRKARSSFVTLACLESSSTLSQTPLWVPRYIWL